MKTEGFVVIRRNALFNRPAEGSNDHRVLEIRLRGCTLKRLSQDLSRIKGNTEESLGDLCHLTFLILGGSFARHGCRGADTDDVVPAEC